jgi:hypothetical protein
MKNFRWTNITPLLLLGGFLAVAFPASADIVVTYTTSGSFNGSGSTFTGSNSASVTYLGLSGAGCVSNPASPNCDANFQATLGTFSSSIPSNSSLTPSGTFTVTIDQTLYPYIGFPCCSGSGSGTLSSASFTGSLSAGTGPATGSAILTFTSPATVVIQGVSYTLDNLTNGSLTIGPNASAVSLGALISVPAGTTTFSNPTPEPALFGLTGAGLIGLAAMVMRRKRRQAV